MKFTDPEKDPRRARGEGEEHGQYSLQSAQSISELELSHKLSNDLLLNWSESTKCLLESTNADATGETEEFIQYAWRWVNTACIFGPIIAQSCLMMVFSPITAILRDAYETTDTMVDSNATVFFIVTLIVNFPSVYLLESGETQGKVMSTWFRRACILTIVGQWGRYLSIVLFPNEFWLTIFPAGMIAIGQSFFVNGISKLACIWFGDQQRPIAIGVLTFGLALGSCIGFCIGSFFVFEEDKDDHDKIKDQTIQFMWSISWATTFLCAPAIFLYEQKPPTFPSISAKQSANLQKKRQMTIMDELPILWQNQNFKYTFLIFTVMNGSMNSLSAILTFLIEPFGFNSYDSSLLGVTSVLTGFVSSFIFPILIQKYNWYLRSMRIMVFGALVAMVAIMMALTSSSLYYAMPAIALFGLFNIPATSIVYTYATEITYPVSETLFACIFQAGSCLFSSTLTYLSLYLIDNVSATCVTIIYVIFYALCGVIVCFLTEDLRRLKLSKENEEGLNSGHDFSTKTIK